MWLVVVLDVLSVGFQWPGYAVGWLPMVVGYVAFLGFMGRSWSKVEGGCAWASRGKVVGVWGRVLASQGKSWASEADNLAMDEVEVYK